MANATHVVFLRNTVTNFTSCFIIQHIYYVLFVTAILKVVFVLFVLAFVVILCTTLIKRNDPAPSGRTPALLSAGLLSVAEAANQFDNNSSELIPSQMPAPNLDEKSNSSELFPPQIPIPNLGN